MEPTLLKIDKQYKVIEALIAVANRLKDQPMPLNYMFNTGIEIIAQQAYFNGLIREAEQVYRKRVIEIMDKEDSSFASAEARAKSEDAYRLWRAAEGLNELARDAQLLIKKVMGANEQVNN